MMQDAETLKLSNSQPAVTQELMPLFSDIAAVIQQSRRQVQQTVNSAMVQCYWQIGRLIVEHEQQGQARAAYGKHQLQALSEFLTAEFGKGFDASNLRNMRSFYLCFPNCDALRHNLKYLPYLPTEAELKHELELERIKVQAQLLNKADEAGND